MRPLAAESLAAFLDRGRTTDRRHALSLLSLPGRYIPSILGSDLFLFVSLSIIRPPLRILILILYPLLSLKFVFYILFTHWTRIQKSITLPDLFKNLKNIRDIRVPHLISVYRIRGARVQSRNLAKAEYGTLKGAGIIIGRLGWASPIPYILRPFGAKMLGGWSAQACDLCFNITPFQGFWFWFFCLYL